MWSTFLNICCGSKKVVAKSRAWVYFEHYILALLLVFHQTCILSWINIKKINQSVHYISSICDKCFCCTTVSSSCEVKKAKHRPRTCNETMLCYKFSTFVSCISPPLFIYWRILRMLSTVLKWLTDFPGDHWNQKAGRSKVSASPLLITNNKGCRLIASHTVSKN